MPQATPLKALIALAILTSGALLDPAPAQARRFGGGHSSGVSRSISTHSAPSSHISHGSPSSARSAEPTDRPPYPIEHAALPPSRASVQDNFHWPDAASSVLARARIEAARSRQANRQRDNAFAPVAAPTATANDTWFPAGTAMSFDAGRPTRNESALAENSSRPADPRFARLTDSQRAPSAPCEFKPVMSDADYIACGATPPQFPLAR
jgi:hypothetical protein